MYHTNSMAIQALIDLCSANCPVDAYLPIGHRSNPYNHAIGTEAVIAGARTALSNLQAEDEVE